MKRIIADATRMICGSMLVSSVVISMQKYSIKTFIEFLSCLDIPKRFAFVFGMLFLIKGFIGIIVEGYKK